MQNSSGWFMLLLLSHVAAAGLSHGEEAQPRREYFYVGGEYANFTVPVLGNATAQYMINQIYAEKLTPPVVSRKHPIVFVHGSGQTATNFLETPDGRPGWATFFLSHGYVVYLSDQPSRGRSPWYPSIGTLFVSSTSDIESALTATSSHGLWPQAWLHTQWPGTGIVGDPIFDAFYASQVQFQADELISEAQNTKAYTALLDKIGPAHLITHSQSGPYGWRIGDHRPHLVKSIVALEPGGPPFIGQFPYVGPFRPWGITYLDVAYEPFAGPNGTLIQTLEPAKQLINLAQIPALVVTGETSFHAPYDYCTVEYLRQAGVQVEFADLGEEGIHGNGHMLFMEKNNLEIAERVLGWLARD